MTDRPARTEEEIESRKKVVSLAQDMLGGKLPFLEGANPLYGLSIKVGGVEVSDPDFMVFTGIASDSDHLPLEKQRQYWQPEALKRLEPEIKQKKKRHAWLARLHVKI